MLQADPTTLLTAWRRGNRVALDELFPLVYEDLRRRAHQDSLLVECKPGDMRQE
jgi:hypothetical protein